MDPRCMFGRIYRVIYIATHTILNIWVLWFRRRRFFLCFPIFNLGELYVVMEIRVLAQNLTRQFPHHLPKTCTLENTLNYHDNIAKKNKLES